MNTCASSIGRCYQSPIVTPLVVLTHIGLLMPAVLNSVDYFEIDPAVVYLCLVAAVVHSAVQSWVIQHAPYHVYSMLVDSVRAMEKTIVELKLIRDDLTAQIQRLNGELGRLRRQIDRFANENQRLEKQVGGLKIINDGLKVSLDGLANLEPALKSIARNIMQDLEGQKEALGVFYDKLLKLDELQTRFQVLYHENLRLLETNKSVTLERKDALEKLKAIVDESHDDEMVEQVELFLQDILFLSKGYRYVIDRLEQSAGTDAPTKEFVQVLNRILLKSTQLSDKFCGPACRQKKAIESQLQYFQTSQSKKESDPPLMAPSY